MNRQHEPQTRVEIASDVDIVTARNCGRRLATRLGFTSGDATLVATAISELARNIILYARRGEVIVKAVEEGEARGVLITARDEGEGIADLEQALRIGYSTSGHLGVGLPGVRRLMDDFEIVSEVGKGTTVTVKKWKR